MTQISAVREELARLKSRYTAYRESKEKEKSLATVEKKWEGRLAKVAGSPFTNLALRGGGMMGAAMARKALAPEQSRWLVPLAGIIAMTVGYYEMAKKNPPKWALMAASFGEGVLTKDTLAALDTVVDKIWETAQQ